MEDCSEAIRLNPKDAGAFKLRGHAKGSLGDYRGELEDCSEAIRLNPNEVDAFRLRGHAKENLGNYQEALEDLETFVRMGGNRSVVAELIAKLEQITTTESSSTVVNPVTSSDERKPSAQSTLTIDEEFKKAERYYKKQEYKRAERHYKIAAKHGYPNAKEKLKEVESLLNKLKIQASSSAASSATAVTSADQANSYYSISSLNTLSGSASPLGTSTSTKHKSLTNSSASTDAVTVPTAASLGLSSSAIAYASLKRGEKLGSGGFGVVYKGEWQYTTVAIKQLKLESLSNDSQNEFNKEVALMQALRHPHVVTFYGACTEPGKYAIVMEYCALGSLFNWLRTTEAENWSLRLKIAGEIARGLAYLHSQKILHRDLKSLNVLLDEHTKAKITDFGLSKVKTETASTTTAAASTGTLMWMAPELFSIKGKHSEKSDMYAYGITLWEIAARKLPYEEARGNSEVIRTSVKEGEREDIPESTPPSMVKLIAKCWAQRAEERPTAAEAILMLEEKETPADATAAAVMSYRGNLVSHK